MNTQVSDQQFDIGDGIVEDEARPQSRDSIAVDDLHIALESVRDIYEAYGWGLWRMDPDDDATGDTFWIARHNFEWGWRPAEEENDDSSPTLPGYGRPRRGARTWTGHPLRRAANAPPVRLGRRGLEIVALASGLLHASPVQYDRLEGRERQAAIVGAVAGAMDLLTRDRQVALNLLADRIEYQEFGRGALEYRRRQLDWLLDGMSSDVVFCRHCSAVLGPDDPLDPRDVRAWATYRLGPTDLSPRLSAHEACRAAHKKEPASWW